MKGLTLTQPWATLVALGAKTIETRDWWTNHRSELLITAAKKFPADARGLCPVRPFSDALGMETLFTGAAVAVVDLVECFKFDALTEKKIERRSARGDLPAFEATFGDYGAGRYGFVLRNVRRIKNPIPCKGALGIWETPKELEMAVYEALAVGA